MFVLEKLSLIKNLCEKKKYQNHTCTIHRNTTNSFIPLGSNIQFSTNTEKEQIIKKTCNNKQIEFLCVQTPFQIT
jgi:hypothetical protein